MEVKVIIAIVIIAAIVGGAIAGFGAYSSANRYVDPMGAVHYFHPENDYQVAVEEANNYVPVYEEEIPDNEIGDVQGQTWFQGDKAIKIIIEHQEAGIVYHEMYHAITPGGGTEPDADAYATARGFPMHDATY